MRDADYLAIFCAEEPQAYRALSEVRRWKQAQGLGRHPSKAHFGDCRRRGEGLEFLGYRVERGRRWVVERTFGWLKLSRRLSKDYVRLMSTSETWIHLAMI